VNWCGIGRRLGSTALATTFLSLVLLFPAATLADTPTPTVPTTVAGTVADHTQGAPAVGKLAVTLRVYQNQQLQKTLQTETDAAGHYQFSGLSSDPAYQYLPVVHYQGVDYSGDAVRLADAQNDGAHDDVAVFETTAQDPGLRYENATLVLGSVEQASQHLSFLELLTLTNPSDRTYVPATPTQGMATGLLRFTLPSGVDDIGVQNGLDSTQLIEVDGGLASTAPVAPGMHTISFSFAVPYQGAAFAFAWNIIYPATAVHVLEPANGPPLRAGTLSASPDLPLQGQTFRVLSGGAAGANTTVNITVSDLPGRTPLQALQAALPNGKIVPIGALVIAVLAALVPVVYLVRRRAARDGAPRPTADSLLDELATLDDAHERGDVDEEAYTARRAALKAQLARLMLSAQQPDAEVSG
jgi:hypothetical protein